MIATSGWRPNVLRIFLISLHIAAKPLLGICAAWITYQVSSGDTVAQIQVSPRRAAGSITSTIGQLGYKSKSGQIQSLLT